MSKIRSTKTKPELMIKKELEKYGFTYQPKIFGKPDFANKKEKIAVFVDGCFWHKCPICYKEPVSRKEFWLPKIEENVKRDEKVNCELRKKGWKIIRVWEHEIKSDLKKSVNKVKKGFKMNEQLNQIEGIEDDLLWKNYAMIIKELKARKLIRTRNIAGERGEQLALEIYNSTPNEPNLQAAPEGTQNVDALSRKGERYAIKTVTLPRKLTGVFYGLNPPDSGEPDEKKFEYLIVVMINDFFEPVKILECKWDIFLNFKKWHKTMRAWNISVTRKFEEESRLIFEKNA